MNNVKKSLCLLLIAATSTVGCSRLIHKSKIDVPKENLELVAKQNTYISPDGNYSLMIDPALYGFALKKHSTEPDSCFRDVYQTPIGYSFIFGSKDKGELNELYERCLFKYTMILSDRIMNPDDSTTIEVKIKPLTDGTPDNTIIDGNPALTGAVELLLTPRDIPADNTNTQKLTVGLTIYRDKDDRLYKSVWWNREIKDDPDCKLSHEFQKNFIDSFEPLKK